MQFLCHENLSNICFILNVSNTFPYKNTIASGLVSFILFYLTRCVLLWNWKIETHSLNTVCNVYYSAPTVFKHFEVVAIYEIVNFIEMIDQRTFLKIEATCWPWTMLLYGNIWTLFHHRFCWSCLIDLLCLWGLLTLQSLRLLFDFSLSMPG